MNKFDHDELEVIKLQKLGEFSLSDLLTHLKYLNYSFRIESNESGYILSIVPKAGKIIDSFYGDTIDKLIKEVINNRIVNHGIK